MRLFVSCFRLLFSAGVLLVIAACSGGGGSTPSPPPPAPPPPPPPPSGAVEISGVVTYDDVPLNTATNGLNYAATAQRPARGVTVDAVDSSGAVLDSTITNASGQYTVTVDPNTTVRIRANARLLQTSGATWDVTARDNTNNNAIYVLGGSLTTSGTTNSTRNLNAPSGWGGAGYTGTRVAAPFAILDTIYTSLQLVAAAEPGETFPAFQVFWSINNRSASGDVTNGDIGSSSYTRIGGVPTILILGDENDDTDEYDDHVVSHEFGHYLEDQLARSDSIGGRHSLGDRLDPRVAMGEGWGNAFSAMALDNPIYRDSSGAQQAVGFSFNIESNTNSPAGWYNEASVHSIIYDIFDTASDGADTISAGFAPIYTSITAPEYVQNIAPTSIFTFAESLRANAGLNNADLNALIAAQSINGTGSFGDGETNSGGIAIALPVVKSTSVGAAPLEVCSFDDAGTFNKVGNRQLIRLTLPTSTSYTFTMVRTSGPTGRDPDFFIYRAGSLINVGGSEDMDSEVLVANFSAGEYWIDAHDFLNIDEDGPSGDVCFDFSVV